ncbi:MAG: MarR family transcriptional regulator [Nocardioidaceae bacterium]
MPPPPTDRDLPSTEQVPHQPVADALADSTGYLMHRAHMRAEQVGLRHVPAGGHPRDFAFLSMLQAFRPTSQIELSHALNVNRSAMVKLVDDLEERDLVVRRRDPADRRRHVIALTDHGQQYLRELSGSATRGDRELRSALSAAEVDELNRLLRPIATQRLDPTFPPELLELTAFLVVHAHFRLLHLGLDGLAEIEMQPRHYGVLAVLADLGPVPQQQVAYGLCISGAWLVDLIDTLEESGRVQRRRNADDRRAYDLTITPKGRRDLAAASTILEGVTAEATEEIGADGRDRLTLLLHTLVTGE